MFTPSRVHREYIRHLGSSHRQGPLLCNYRKKCIRTYRSISGLKNHIQNDHGFHDQRIVRGSEAVRLIQFSLKCEFAHCGEVHNSKVKLLQHYKIAHRKEKKPCIFEDCDTTVDLFSSLVKHIKKKHDGKNHALKKQIVCNSDSGSLSSELPAESQDLDQESSFDDEEQSTVLVEDEDEEEYSLKDGIDEQQTTSFELGYAEFLNRLLCFQFIPMATIVKINAEISALVNIASQTRDSIFVTALHAHSIPGETTKSIMQTLRSKTDIFQETFEKFRTVKKVESYLTENFPYVKPKTFKLGDGSFQYVSIVETLKKITGDKTFQKFKKTTNSPQDDGATLMADIEDGLAFKESEFFRINPGALK